MGAVVPKQFLSVGGRSLLDRTLSSVSAASRVDAIVLALPADAAPEAGEAYRGFPKVIAVVKGGGERHDSVRNALAAVPSEASIILVAPDGMRFPSGGGPPAPPPSTLRSPP